MCVCVDRVDKRGRKSSLSSTENLKKYYDITGIYYFNIERYYCSSEDDVKTDHNGDKSESNEGEDKEDEGEESEDKNESSGDEDSSSTDIDFDEINDNNEVSKFTRECAPPTLIRYLMIGLKRMQPLSSLMRSLLD